MEWIKVRNETVVPTDVDVLIRETTNGKILKGRIIPDTDFIFEPDNSNIIYVKDNYSHYCVISVPVKVEYIEVESHKITKDILDDILFKSFILGSLEGILANYEVTILSEHLFNQLKQESIKNYAK